MIKRFNDFQVSEKETDTPKGFKSDIDKDTVENEDFRKVLYSAAHLQLVLMSMKGEEEIGEEIHQENDQFFRIEKGSGWIVINGNKQELSAGDAVIVPAGSKHNIIAGPDGLKLYTIYAPPHHKDGIVRKSKKDAKNNPEEFDGKTTE